MTVYQNFTRNNNCFKYQLRFHLLSHERNGYNHSVLVMDTMRRQTLPDTLFRT